MKSGIPFPTAGAQSSSRLVLSQSGATFEPDRVRIAVEIDNMGRFLDSLWGIPLAVVSWIVLHMVAKPVLNLREQRLDVLRLAERYAYFGPTDNAERVSVVRREIFDAASGLLVHSRGGSKLARLYCKAFGYDLEEAASALRGIGSMAGELHSDDVRTNNLSHVYISLRAGHHLTPEARRSHQAAIDETKAKVNG
jgi:hypothetical protein